MAIFLPKMLSRPAYRAGGVEHLQNPPCADRAADRRQRIVIWLRFAARWRAALFLVPALLLALLLTACITPGSERLGADHDRPLYLRRRDDPVYSKKRRHRVHRT